MARPKKIKEKKVRAAKAPKTVKAKNPPKEKKVKQSANIAFFEKIVATAGNDLASAASNGIVSGDVTGWIDTGVYMLNAQYSGSLFGGVPDNKILVFAGPEAVGKTYFILSIIKFFLDSNPEAGVVFCESEGAISKEMLEERGIDTNRIWIVPVSTVQEWRTQSLKVLAAYKASPEDQRRPMMFCLDSLGMLSTTKEMEDTESGSEKADMTRARLIKAAFRTMTLKLGVLHVPFLITNHTYDTQGLFSTKTMSGGSGTKYANSLTIFLGKSKEKEGTEVVGSLIRSTLKKGRLTKENTQVEVKLYYDRGLDRYYGLLELGLKYEIFTKVKEKKTDKTEKIKIGDQFASEKVIYSNPEKYFTQEVLQSLEPAAGKEFKYGSSVLISSVDAESEVDDAEETDAE